MNSLMNVDSFSVEHFYRVGRLNLPLPFFVSCFLCLSVDIEKVQHKVFESVKL